MSRPADRGVPIDVLKDVPRTGVRIANHYFATGPDRGLAVLLIAASWVLQRLPGQVVEHQRAELVKTWPRRKT
jgi:hypothetical protein